MNFELTEEHKMIRDAARDFAQTELLPGVIERDEYSFIAEGDSTIIHLNASYQAKSYILGCVLPFFKSKFKNIDEVSLKNFKAFAEK